MSEPKCPSPSVALSTTHIHAFLRDATAALRLVAGPPPKKPLVLFLPGGPGSRLIRNRDGKVIFGENCVVGKDIALTSAGTRDVKTEILLAYKVLGFDVEDVYKSILPALEAAIGEYGELKPWPYDWRLDAEEGAKQLQQDLETTGNRREVFIVAHSHGGAVAWKWQERYHAKQPFTVHHMVLLGSPLRGSCDFGRVLTKGFGPPPGVPNDWITSLVRYRLLAGIRPAAFTMPGTFLILSPQPRPSYPEGELDAACLDQIELRCGKEPIARILNPQSLAFWKDTDLGRGFVDRAWEKLKITEGEFWKCLEEAITLGNRHKPDLSRRNIRHMRYFYSMDYPTTRKVRLVLDEQGRLVSKRRVAKAGMGNENPLTLTELGDSRVLASTPREPRICTQRQDELCAECAGATAAKPACCIGPLKGVCVDRITLAHGRLPDSEEFRVYVRNVLGPTIWAMNARALGLYFSRSADARGVLAGNLTHFTSAAWGPLIGEVEATQTDAEPLRALRALLEL
jgi:pimeloyl-ACP methyl ester carboxylesterase